MKNSSNSEDFGLNPDELRLVPAGSEWALRFLTERELLSNALGPAAIDIQHVGSTAVLGILAKPILDLAVAIPSFEYGHALVPILEALGYEYRGEYGISRRHYFVKGRPRRTHHLHMLEKKSEDWKRHIHFRDRLRESSALAAQYSELKLNNLSDSAGNRDRYQSLKASFIAAIYSPAHGCNSENASSRSQVHNASP